MISHFSSQLSGGANIAARRLHEALVRNGIDSKFFYGEGISNDPTYLPFYQNKTFYLRNLAALSTSWRNRQDQKGGLILSPRWIRKTPLKGFGEVTKVINLHWVSRWLDLPSFMGSLPSGIPVVWTLHDLIPITGGCVYPRECDGYTRGCGNCPQLKKPSSSDASRKFYSLKADWFKKLNLHIVGNSSWTTEQANRSGLGKIARSITTIHYGLDANQYIPIDKAIAREALQIPNGKFVIGFACSDFHEKRKGAEILLRALELLPSSEILLVVLGGGLWPRDASRFETIQMGSIGSPRLQSLFYSSLDVFAMPSEVETFGNVAMEAMACETPVIGFPAGGLADVVEDGVTGLIEKDHENVRGLSEKLKWMLQRSDQRKDMGIFARNRVLNKFTDCLMAQRYMNLYSKLLPYETTLKVDTSHWK